jgi:hypothetical protein
MSHPFVNPITLLKMRLFSAEHNLVNVKDIDDMDFHVLDKIIKLMLEQRENNG